MTSSFGRPDPDVQPDRGVQESPTPVLHVGEVHAELRLTVSDETLRDLGSQIASMIAAATRQGFEHGLAAALNAAGGGDTADPSPVSTNR